MAAELLTSAPQHLAGKEMPMKASTKLLFALAAAGLSAVMTLPASAQKFVPRGDQTCANPSTARDKTQQKTDARCLRPKSGPGWEKYADERAGQRLNSFIKANPPQKTTDVFGGDGNKHSPFSTVYTGVDGRGVPYRIIVGEKGFSGSGSASGLSRNYSGKGRAPR
jgi:hypothetical protein